MENHAETLLENLNLLNELISKVDVNGKNKRGISSFHYFLDQRYSDFEPSEFLEALSMFLDGGARIKNSEFKLLMKNHASALIQNIDLLKELIGKVQDVNEKNGDGYSIFYWFLLHFDEEPSQYLEALSIFLESGADINDVYPPNNVTGFQLLVKIHCSELLLNMDLLNNLLGKIKDVNARDKYGYSCFHLFLKKGNLEHSTFLEGLTIFIEHGADINDEIAQSLLINNSAFKKYFLCDMLSKVKNKLQLSQLRRAFSIFLSSSAGYYVLLLLIRYGDTLVFRETFAMVKPFSPNKVCSPCCASAVMIYSCNHQMIRGLMLLLQYEVLRNGSGIFSLKQRNVLFSKLFSESCSGLELSFWKEQFEACVSEILRMKKDIVVCCYTFNDYVSRLLNQESLPPCPDMVFKKVTEYPNCRGIITASIVRHDLIYQDMTLSLCSDKEILLNADCCNILRKYLSGEDLKNILIPPRDTVISTRTNKSCHVKVTKRKLSV